MFNTTATLLTVQMDFRCVTSCPLDVANTLFKKYPRQFALRRFIFSPIHLYDQLFSPPGRTVKQKLQDVISLEKTRGLGGFHRDTFVITVRNETIHLRAVCFVEAFNCVCLFVLHRHIINLLTTQTGSEAVFSKSNNFTDLSDSRKEQAAPFS